MTLQQGTYQIICTSKTVINSLASIYQDKQVQEFLQKGNFIEKLEEENSAKLFFIAEKQQKTTPNFSLDSLNVTE